MDTDQQAALAGIHRQIIERFPMYQTHPAFEQWLFEKADSDPRKIDRHLDLVEEYGIMSQEGLLDQTYTSLPEPDAVAHDIEHRLAGLPPEALRALQAGSVEGKRFSSEVVAALIGASREEAERHLDAAERTGVLRRDGTEQLYDGLGTRYRFVPLGTQDHIYRQMPQEELSDWHAKLVEFLSGVLSRVEDQGAGELISAMIALHNGRVSRPSPSPAKP
jgi:hypothetical protein